MIFFKKSKIQKQTDIADYTLRLLQEFDPNCLVAGGAPRDWVLKKVAKDIDIYLFTNSVLEIINKLAINGFIFKGMKEGDTLPENYAKAAMLSSVLDFTYLGEDLQVMMITSPTMDVIDSFPLSISRITYTRKTGIVQSEDFNKGLLSKTIYCDNILYDDNHKYIQKILKKFPDWKYERTSCLTLNIQ